MRKLAQKAKVSHSEISRIERGDVVPKISTVYALANALKIDIQQIFDESRGESDG